MYIKTVIYYLHKLYKNNYVKFLLSFCLNYVKQFVVLLSTNNGYWRFACTLRTYYTYVHYFSREAKEIRERDRKISSESAIPVNVTIALQSPPTAPSSAIFQFPYLSLPLAASNSARLSQNFLYKSKRQKWKSHRRNVTAATSVTTLDAGTIMHWYMKSYFISM